MNTLALVVAGICGNVLAVIARAGVIRLGGEGDSMDKADGRASGNSGEPAASSPPWLSMVVGPRTPKEPGRFEVLSDALARDGKELSLLSLDYLVREGQKRARDRRAA